MMERAKEPETLELEALAQWIVALDPTGPVPEASRGLRALHRELVAALGPELARWRFDEALRRALARPASGAARAAAPCGAPEAA